MAEVVQVEPSVEAGVLRCTPSWFLVGRVWTDGVEGHDLCLSVYLSVCLSVSVSVSL